jgi:hypothetical protein
MAIESLEDLLRSGPTKASLLKALQDPQVLAFMRTDPGFAHYFDAEGELTVDLGVLMEDGSRRKGGT